MFNRSIQNKKAFIDNVENHNKFEVAVDMIVSMYENGGSLYLAGNGGSAADAQHVAAELVCRFKTDRPALAAESFAVDPSTVTAIGNDYGFDQIFARQVEAKLTSKDIFFAISTSGASPNIINGLKATKSKNGRSILLAGNKGGAGASIADLLIVADGENAGEIQELHLVIEHALCAAVESRLFNIT